MYRPNLYFLGDFGSKNVFLWFLRYIIRPLFYIQIQDGLFYLKKKNYHLDVCNFGLCDSGRDNHLLCL